MAISIKPNQSLGFTPKDACNCGTAYCQPIQQSDSILLQGFASIASEDNLVGDPSFQTNVAGPGASAYWDLDANWAIAGGKLSATLATSGQTTESVLPLHLQAGHIYIVQTKVAYTGGGGGWRISINGQYLKIAGTTLGAYSQQTAVTGTWLFMAGAIANDKVIFQGDTSTWNIEYFNIAELSMPGVALYDNSGVLVVDAGIMGGANQVNYLYNGSEFTADTLQIETTEVLAMNVSVLFNIVITDILDLATETGCMTLRVYDTVFLSQRIKNGNFASDLSYWTAGTHWSWVAGKADYAGDGFTAGTLCQIVYLLGGNTYDLTFSLGGASGGTVVVLADFNDGAGSVNIGTVTGNGPHTVTVDMTNFTSRAITICFTEGTELTFTVDGVSLVGSEPDSDNTSNCINIQEEHDCTLYFEASNSDNAFGFDYSAFSHALRVYASMKFSGYPEEAENFMFSDNSYATMYARTEKEYEVKVGDAAEHIHDCLRMMRLNDSFTVTRAMADGTTETTQLISSGDYGLKPRQRSDNAQAIFPVKNKTGIGSNYSCA